MATRAKNEADAAAEAVDETSIEYWTFDKKGKKITARVDKIRTATIPNGVNGPFSYPILWITEVSSGTQFMLHAYPEVLLTELRSVKPEPGDVITVEYMGTKVTGSNRTAKIFEVTKGDGQPESFDWDTPNF